MFQIDDRQVRQLAKELDKLNRRGMPFAVRQTLNNLAFSARANGQDNIENQMTLRNKWSVRSVQVEKASGLDIDRMASVTGSAADYLAVQESGGTKTKSGSEGVAIPTSWSAGQQGAQPRTRLPRRPNKLADIQLANRRKVKGSRQRKNLVATLLAAKSGHKFVYMDLGRRKGIFRVQGSRTRPRVKMAHDLTRQSVRVPRNLWLAPAAEKAAKSTGVLFGKALAQQLARLR